MRLFHGQVYNGCDPGAHYCLQVPEVACVTDPERLARDFSHGVQTPFRSNQFAFGAQADFRKPSWPVNITGEYFYSGSDEDKNFVDHKGGTFELGLGLRKYWENLGTLKPYAGGGPALMCVCVFTCSTRWGAGRRPSRRSSSSSVAPGQ